MASLNRKGNHFRCCSVTSDGKWSVLAVLLKRCSRSGIVTDSEHRVLSIESDPADRYRLDWMFFRTMSTSAHIRQWFNTLPPRVVFLLCSWAKRVDPRTLLTCDTLIGRDFSFHPNQQTTPLQQQVTARHTHSYAHKTNRWTESSGLSKAIGLYIFERARQPYCIWLCSAVLISPKVVARSRISR